MRVGDVVMCNVGGSREMGLVMDQHTNASLKSDSRASFRRMRDLVLVRWFPPNPAGTGFRPQMFKCPELKGDCWALKGASIGWVPVWSDIDMPMFKVISGAGC